MPQADNQPSAWDAALRADNIRSGFEKTGIYPYDKDAINYHFEAEEKAAQQRATAQQSTDATDTAVQQLLPPPRPRRSNTGTNTGATLLTAAEHVALVQRQREEAAAKQKAKEERQEAANRKRQQKAAEQAEAATEKFANKFHNNPATHHSGGAQSLQCQLAAAVITRLQRDQLGLQRPPQAEAARRQALERFRAKRLRMAGP